MGTGSALRKKGSSNATSLSPSEGKQAVAMLHPSIVPPCARAGQPLRKTDESARQTSGYRSSKSSIAQLDPTQMKDWEIAEKAEAFMKPI
ncbi:hypothetical protein ACFL6U_04090 [Planctomycetota bacterium]